MELILGSIYPPTLLYASMSDDGLVIYILFILVRLIVNAVFEAVWYVSAALSSIPQRALSRIRPIMENDVPLH